MTVDLSGLPTPNLVENLDFESYLTRLKEDLQVRDATLSDALDLESEPLVKLLQTVAYRETILRQKINDSAQALMIATATGNDLDNLVALLGVDRLTVVEADPEANPPIEEVLESDDALRYRSTLALEASNSAGTAAAYEAAALGADGDVKSAGVISAAPGEVEIYVVSHSNGGVPPQAVLDAVEAATSHAATRALSDVIFVYAAQTLAYDITAVLTIPEGPDREVIRQNAETSVTAYAAAQAQLGATVALSGIYAALHQTGVESVSLTLPAADVVAANSQVPTVGTITVTIAGA